MSRSRSVAAALKFVRAAFEAALVFRAETVKANDSAAALKKSGAT
ncbi:MAG TPA: hypothetical protein VNU48_09260 [Burkholderiaceae bacterium]|nr:hypothetical protein [Burkholderiaceae bacterium]